MSGVHNTVEIVNAAATAIVTAESRTQPTTAQKRRWGSCWSLYWCFGSYKDTKRIGHAVLVPEPPPPPQPPGGSAIITATQNPNPSTTTSLPFIAPPSSPASFLQSDPPSATLSPPGFLSLKSLSAAASGTAPIFVIGPYAHETQLVSPPVYSTYTTEPSTASFTPPPESVQITTPSSPEVPFSQLVTSSLARNRRKSESSWKFSLSPYEFQPYPGSPGSAMSNSGTSSPFPDKRLIIEVSMGEPRKFIAKWGSRLGSGTLTPNDWGSRLGSGTLTPNGLDSRVASGTLTPIGGERENGVSKNEESVVIDHRVSFELTCDDIPTFQEKETTLSSYEINTRSSSVMDLQCKGNNGNDLISGKTGDGEAEECHHKHRSVSLGSSKDFKFYDTKGDNEEAVGNVTENKWGFFQMLQPGGS